MRVPYSLEFFRKWFADGTSLPGVTSSRHREHLAHLQFGGNAAWTFVCRLSKWTYYCECLLGKQQRFPYETIKGNANKTLPLAQYKVPIYQLSAIIYTRRSRRAQGGTRCQLWCMATCTWSWGQGEEPSLWTQTCMDGIGLVLGMQLNGKACFKCTGPYRSIAKCAELAKYSKKHTVKKYRQNLYIQTTASRCLSEHLEIITMMKIIFLHLAPCAVFVNCVLTKNYVHNFCSV